MNRLFAAGCVGSLAILAAPAAPAAPRLLMSFPRQGGVYGLTVPRQVRPLTFVFSEPMDTKSVVLPNTDNSNADRSFDLEVNDLSGALTPEAIAVPITAAGPPIARDGGLVIEVPGSRVGSVLRGGGALHVFARGFHSLKGEWLDKDYTIGFRSCQGCITTHADILRASVPADGQANADPSAALSIYFGTALDATSFTADLTAGARGPAIAPITLDWDMAAPSVVGDPPQIGGVLHVLVSHPRLTATPRPYYFTTPRQVFAPGRSHLQEPLPLFPYLEPDMPHAVQIRFTVGPALAGDLNGDGQVTVADVVLALRAALGFLTLTDAQTFAADLVPRTGANGRPIGDGQVMVADATYILQRAIGLVPDDQWP